MKIAYIVEPRRVIGGGVRAAMNLSKSMKHQYNVDSTVFGVYENSVEDKDVLFYPVNTLKPVSFSYIRQFGRFVSVYKPDIVHCLGLFSALVCLLYRKFTKSNYAIVCTVHRVSMNMRYPSLIKYVVGFIANNIDFATFLTEYQKNHYYNNIGFRPKKYQVVPNVIFVQKIDRQDSKRLHQEFIDDLDADYMTSYVGRIIPSKNIEDIIKITALANNKGFNLGCVLVGGYDADYYKKLQTLIEELHIGHKIKFIGYVNNPSLYLDAADYTTTTTYGEALPNLLIESYALGKVTFSSDIPQMVDLIDNGVNGFTLPLSNLEEFVDKMDEFCTNSQLRDKMEKAALETYRLNYSPEKVSSIYYDIYRAI